MGSTKRFSRKLLLIVVILACFVCGCAQTNQNSNIHNTLKKPVIVYKIKLIDNKPCISINVENLKPPFTVSLLGPDKRTIDFKYVEYTKDLPAVLYFGISSNIRPGTYYIRLEKFGNLIEEKTLNLKGSKVSIVSCKFNFKNESFIGYELKSITLKLKGTGDCPAFPYWVDLKINGNDYSGILENYNTPTLPGKVQTYTSTNIVCYLKKGRYEAKVIVKGFDGFVLGKKVEEVTVS